MSEKYLKTAGEFEALAAKPQGGWLAKVGDRGTPCVQVDLKVSADDPDCAGQQITWTGWLTEKAFGSTVKRLRDVFGFDGDFENLISGKSTFHGKPCRFTAEDEEYNGKTRLKVKWLNNIAFEGAAPAIDDSEARTIAASFTRKAKMALKEDGETAPAAPAPDASDDVPF